MRELSLNILDIVQNSIKARALRVDITVDIQPSRDTLFIMISDNGTGMDEATLKNAIDPFGTSRSTRKVGMGIPLFKESAESAGGSLEISSTLGVGTMVKAVFTISHIDRMPLGNLAETMVSIIATNPQTEFGLSYSVGNRNFTLDTEDVKEQLGGVPITELEVLDFIRLHLQENINEINGGILV